MVACTGLYRTACTCRVLLYHAIPCNNVLYVRVLLHHTMQYARSLATCCTCRVVVKQPPTPTTHHHHQQHHQQGTRNDLPCSFLLPGLQPRWTLSGRSTRLQAGPPRKAAARDSTSGVRRSGSLAKPRAGCCVVPGCRHAGGYVAKRFVGHACWHLCWRHRHVLESAGEHHGWDAVPAGGQQRRTGAGRVCD